MTEGERGREGEVDEWRRESHNGRRRGREKVLRRGRAKGGRSAIKGGRRESERGESHGEE